MSKDKDLFSVNSYKRLFTITEEAVEKYGNNLRGYLDKIKEETKGWELVNLVFPSTIAVEPEALAEIARLENVRVFNSNKVETHFTRPLAEGELIRNKAGQPVVFSGYQAEQDIVIQDTFDRCPFTTRLDFKSLADNDVTDMTGSETKKDITYTDFHENWRKDDISVLVDNFRNTDGDFDVSTYLSQLSDNEVKRLVKHISKEHFSGTTLPMTPIKRPNFSDEENKADLDYVTKCREYLSEVSSNSTKNNRINEYIFKHLCLDSYFNNDAYGILKEDHDRRTLTLDTEVVSTRTLDAMIDQNLRGDGYIKDNVKIKSKDGTHQQVYLDMFEEQKAKEREQFKWADEKINGRSDGIIGGAKKTLETLLGVKKRPVPERMKIPSNRFILRSVEVENEIETVLGKKQEEQIKKELADRDAKMKGGLSTSEADMQAMIDLKNKDLFDGLNSLRTARFNSPVVPKNLFRENEAIEDVYLGDNVEVVDDFAFKNSLIERVHGGKNVRRYGKQAFAQTTKEDNCDFKCNDDPDEIKKYMERPYRDNTDKSGFLKSTQDKNYKGVTFLDTAAFLNTEEIDDGAFMNSKLKVGTHNKHKKETLNAIRASKKLKKIGDFGLFHADVETITATTTNSHLKIGDYGCAYNSELDTVDFRENEDGSKGVDYSPSSFAHCGESGVRNKDRSLRTEGHNELVINTHDKIHKRAFMCANIRKIKFAAGFAGHVAKSAFAGCFNVNQITVPESIATILITPFQLAGAIAGLLYRHTLKPYVDRALAKWLKKDPDDFYGTADQFGRDLPGNKEEIEKGKELALREIEMNAEAGTELEVSKGTNLESEGKEPTEETALAPESDFKKQFVWFMFMELVKKSMQRGLTTDEYLDSLGKPALEKEDLVEITDYTELSDVDSKESKDPDNPQRKYPDKLFDYLRFEKKDGINVPHLSLPQDAEDSIISKDDRSNVHISQSKEEGSSGITVLTTTPAELDKPALPSPDKAVTLSLSDEEMKKFYLTKTGVDITDDKAPFEEIQKVYDKLLDIAKDDYNKYMEIAKKCTCEYLYRREAKGNTKSASEIYQRGVRKLFTKSMLEQIAFTSPLRSELEKNDRSPYSLILNDGTKVDCSWNKVRGKDEYNFQMYTTRPVDAGLTKKELLKKYPFICENNEALGKCYLYTSHPEYQELLKKQSADMIKPFPGDAGDSSLKIKYDKKTDKYSLFVVNKSFGTKVPTTLDAQQLSDFSIYMANSMVSCMAFEGNSFGLRPNTSWENTHNRYRGMSQNAVFKTMGIRKEKEPVSKADDRSKSSGLAL